MLLTTVGHFLAFTFLTTTIISLLRTSRDQSNLSPSFRLHCPTIGIGTTVRCLACTAKPNQGFEFVSWQENLPRNSTQLLSVVSPASFFDSILDVLHLRPDKPESS